jgi:hypothetical protein
LLQEKGRQVIDLECCLEAVLGTLVSDGHHACIVHDEIHRAWSGTLVARCKVCRKRFDARQAREV